MAADISDIRITDPHIKGVIEKHQKRRNENGGTGTPTKTAGQLILEYDAILEAREASSKRPPRKLQTA